MASCCRRARRASRLGRTKRPHIDGPLIAQRSRNSVFLSRATKEANEPSTSGMKPDSARDNKLFHPYKMEACGAGTVVEFGPWHALDPQICSRHGAPHCTQRRSWPSRSECRLAYLREPRKRVSRVTRRGFFCGGFHDESSARPRGRGGAGESIPSMDAFRRKACVSSAAAARLCRAPADGPARPGGGGRRPRRLSRRG